MEFLANNSLYIVLLIVLICWIGIYSYLVKLDGKIRGLEQRLNK